MPIDLALVSLPWTLADHPSTQVGVLKAYLKSNGFKVQGFHFHGIIPRILGTDVYFAVQRSNLGEKVSAAAADHKKRDHKIEILSQLRPDVDWQSALEQLDSAFDEWAQILAELDCPRVGFSLSFLQFMGAVTVAERIKASAPEKEIIVGGASLLGDLPPKILEIFPQIDYVVQNEGEVTLLEWLKARCAGEEPDSIPGLWSRNGSIPQKRDALSSLEELPPPDFDEYFQIEPPISAPRLTYEMSRGCFYDKCAFCNHNEVWNIRGVRRKSAHKAADELRTLVHRYKVDQAIFCDTNISDRSDFFDLWRQPDYPSIELNGEVSGHLHRKDFLRMRLAGVKNVQIGVESFSPRTLKLMRKGTSVMRNIEMIRWCGEMEMSIFYNLVTGFPGETEEDRQETIRVMKILQPFQWPRLAHYTASTGSPMHAELAADAAPLNPPEDFEEYYGSTFLPIAAVFDSVIGLELQSKKERVKGWEEIIKFVRSWKQGYEALKQRPGLLYRDNGQNLFVYRFLPKRVSYILQDSTRSVMLFCQREKRTLKQIEDHFDTIPTKNIQRILKAGINLDLVFCEGEKYFFLPVLADPMERFAALQREAEELGM